MRAPAPIGWCDEHQRYFYFAVGCREGGPRPSRREIRAWYDQNRPLGSQPPKSEVPSAVAAGADAEPWGPGE